MQQETQNLLAVVVIHFPSLHFNWFIRISNQSHLVIGQPLSIHHSFYITMMSVMAVTQEQPRTTHGRSNRKRNSPRRTEQRSLKLLGKAFVDNVDDESGHTLPSSSEFFVGSTPTLKSCLKRPASSSNKKSVSFDTIEVREHAIILGDNPSVSSGPPLTIAWESHATFHSSVEDYEASRPPRRTKNCMLVPRMVREEWLRNAGYARSEFADVARVVQRIKKERAASAKGNVLNRFWKTHAT